MARPLDTLSRRQGQYARLPARATRFTLAALLLCSAHVPAGAIAAHPTAQAAPEVVAELTSPAPGERLHGRAEIAGYEAAPTAADGADSGLSDVRVYLGEPADATRLLGHATVGPGLPPAAIAGPANRGAGFRLLWETCTFPSGPYTPIVALFGPQSPSARSTASVDVFVEPCSPGTIIAERDVLDDTGGVLGPGPEGLARSTSWLDPVFGDFAAGVDARCSGEPADCRYGLDFRALPAPGASGAGARYRFTVDPADGSYALDYWTADEDPPTPIIPPTPSTAIQRGGATNRLGVVAQGPELRLFVNAQQIAAARDERRAWGRLGWAAETRPRGAGVRLANLLVSTPGPLDTLAALLSGGRAPSLVPGPSVPGSVLLSDDFSNPNSGWPRQSTDPTSRRVGYEGGEYLVAKLAGNSGAPIVTRAERFADFLLQIDARLLAPVTGSYVFVEVRRQDSGRHYSFAVDPTERSFLVLRSDGPDTQVLIPWTDSAAILAGEAANRLGIRAHGPDLTFLVNGQAVGSVRDEALREGTIAFGVGHLREGAAEGRFGNLVISSVD